MLNFSQNHRSNALTRYTPESKIRHPVRLFKEMWKDLKASRELAWRLIIRDISAQYRQTLLGYFWAVFPPVVTSAVFILLNASKIVKIENLDVPYPAYVFVGTVFWQVFVDALNAPLKVISESKSILTKINIPKESLIISGAGQVLFSFGIKFLLLVGVLFYFRMQVNWTIVLLPIPIATLLLLGIMFGILILPIGLLYKDVQPALLIATSGLVFVTPVAYPPSMGGAVGTLMGYNPVTPVLEGTRDIIFRGIPENLNSFSLVLILTLAFLFIGWIIYRLALPIIIEKIGT
jgi:lipopolysaccharide transport system permease protein